MNPWLQPGVVIPLVLGVIGALIGGFFGIKNLRETQRNKSQIPLPPTWPQMWSRMNELDAKIGALGRIITAAADQWPSDRPAPIFDDADIEILSDTLPAAWMQKRKAS